jgi:dienelactone hydrolase
VRLTLKFALALIAVVVISPRVGAVDATRAAAPTVRLLGALAMGPHPVGYRTLDGLSTPASAWYPARADRAIPRTTSMTLASYLGAGTEDFIGFLKSAKLPGTAIDAYVNAPMQARTGAAPTAGVFPIIAMGQGNGERAVDQAVLCEWLASYGFIVVTSDSPMVATPMRTEDEVGPFAERQATDMSNAMAAAAAWPSANGDVRWAMGHSFGSRAALLVAMRDARVKGVVSFDGGIGTATASAAFKAAPSFDAAKATAPILHFYERLDTFMAPEFSLLDALPAKLTRVELPGMHHAHFTSIGFGSAVIPELANLTKAGPELQASLQKMAEQTLAFISK